MSLEDMSLSMTIYKHVIFESNTTSLETSEAEEEAKCQKCSCPNRDIPFKNVWTFDQKAGHIERSIMPPLGHP